MTARGRQFPLGLPLLLAAGVAAPLVFPLLDLAARPAGWAALRESGRILTLLGNTLALAGGAVVLAVPGGVVAAVLLERGRVPGARVLRAAVAVGLFVPLPVYAAGWQAAGGGLGLPDAGGWRPWRQGLLPAVCVHAAAGLPWVVWVVGTGLRTADRRLEDDALLAGGPRAVLRWVLGPRVAAAAALAGCWVAVQAATEVAVTDVMMVRTFAEEVYFQLVATAGGVPAAVAVTAPAWAAAVLLAVGIVRRVGQVSPPAAAVTPPQPLRLHRGLEVAATAGLWGGTLFLVGVPLAGLIARTGSVNELGRVLGAHGGTLADSLLWAAVAGLFAAGFALASCRAAWRSRPFAGVLLVLTAIAWVTPAPLVGLGLKDAIEAVLMLEDAALAALNLSPTYPLLRTALYDHPSPLPAVWACVVRYFPVGVAVLWPAVRHLPQPLLDTAALDGGPRAEWRGVVWPLCRGAFARAAVAVAVLSLGEVVAGKLVQPPGRRTFAEELFNQMHYGADATVAALSLVQIAVTAAACGLFFLASGRVDPGRASHPRGSP